VVSPTGRGTATVAEARSRHRHRHVVAIDGPAAAGKSTVARLLAERLPALLFDTGSLYRALTLAALRAGIAADDAPRLGDLARTVRIDLLPPSVNDGRLADVLLDGEDVTWAIRDPSVDRAVSAVAGHPSVREALLAQQRRIAERGPVVMVGRDIGTVVVPDAGVKIYLDASAEERARRRCEELAGRGPEPDYETVLADIRRRDASDSSRSNAPLLAAPDAVRVGTDGRSIEEVAAIVGRIVRERWAEAPDDAAATSSRA
jgi:cytidylate kinase